MKSLAKGFLLLIVAALALAGVGVFHSFRSVSPPPVAGQTVAATQMDALDEAMRQLAGPNAVDCGLSRGYGVFPNDVLVPNEAGKPFYARQLILTPAQGSVISAGLVRSANGQIYFINFKSPANEPGAKGVVYAVQHVQKLGVYPYINNEKGTQNVSFEDVTVLTPALQKRLLAQNFLSPQEIESSTGGRTRRTIE